MAYIQGQSRDQASLFPVSFDELVPPDHVVRVIDAWVGTLDMVKLGFTHAQSAATGRPAYDPADLLKLYLYGYLNRVRSSRSLERESARNVELMWLVNRLSPDFKTIAEFRRHNSAALVGVCRAFVRFCREASLIGGELVGIDGSKFQAAASPRSVVSAKRLARERAHLEADIARYLAQLDEADRDEGQVQVDAAQVKAALERLRERRNNVATMEAILVERGVAHEVLGEAEARLMKSAEGLKRPAYNVQSAVDAKHALIVHHEVTQEATDNRSLEPMAKATQAVLEQDTLKVVADAGYSNGAQLQACDDSNIEAYVPLNRSTNNIEGGTLYQREDFAYQADQDRYGCPAGQYLVRFQSNRNQRTVTYAGTACAGCALKGQCTNAARRYLSRHMDEAAFARAAARLSEASDMMRRRRSMVEHPFGTLKQSILGNRGRLLMRGLAGARAEMSLAVLAYNLKRAMNILGGQAMQRLITMPSA